jgi:hypothetical protein
MSAHDQLERQLRRSVARNAGRGLAARMRGWSSARGLSALILAAGAFVVLGVAVFALLSLHRHSAAAPQAPPSAATPRQLSRPPSPGPIPRNADNAAIAASFNTAWKKDPACGPRAPGPFGTTTQRSPGAAVLSTLPVLDHPATSADRLPARFYRNGRLTDPLPDGLVYIRYIRLARVVNGTSFYLFPVGNLGRRPISPAAADRCYRLLVATLRAQLPKIPPAKRAVTLRYGTSEFASARWNLVNAKVYKGVFLLEGRPIGGGGGGLASISEIQQTGMLGGGGGGIPPSPIVMDGIVPAGVTTVTLQFPAGRHGNRRLPALSATGNVVNNVFVIPVPTLFERGGWPATATWRSASGKVIKTIDETRSHP